MNRDQKRIIQLEQALMRLLSLEALKNPLASADASAIEEVRELVGGFAPGKLEVPMHAYSYIDPEEKGPEFLTSVDLKGSSGTIDIGEGADGLSMMFEVRDSTATGDHRPHGQLWLGIGPKGADSCLNLVVDLERGEVLEIDTPENDISLSPFDEVDPEPGAGSATP